MLRCALRSSLVCVLAVACAGGWLAIVDARQNSSVAVAIDADDIGGVVTSSKGPEGGVWVIAETKDLPTGFRRIVVTDDQGRYLVPDLPKGRYSVWVRGYGLVDSPRVDGTPGKILNLQAVAAPNARAAAQYYPANYWLSLLRIPDKSEFPGTGLNGNGISEVMKYQAQWINHLKSQCEQCHQLGDKATREIPAALGTFPTSVAAWDRRVKSGQWGSGMSGYMDAFGRPRALKAFADWTDRIAAGEVPPSPPRPSGIERNVVITQWDWAHQFGYIHDIVAADRRDPSRNAHGLVYGTDRYNAPALVVVDPVRNTASRIGEIPATDPKLGYQISTKILAPSPYWGDQIIWDNRENPHNPMLDQKGRVWASSTFRSSSNPAFCKAMSDHPSARYFPRETNGRQLTVYEPSTKRTTLVDTCFGTHHLAFGEDANDTLWLSGGGDVLGWLNTKLYDQTHDAAKSQGWIPFIVDTNGNGRPDAFVGPDDAVDPTKDKRFGSMRARTDTLIGESGWNSGFYGIAVNPVDGTVWGAIVAFPGAIVRVNAGSNPPATSLSEVYEPPFNNPKAPVQGFTPRGIDVDRNGIVWTGLESGHLASFDRRKCKVLNGPTALGQHCPEGWTLHPTPGPQFKGLTDSGSADFHYYDWVDQFDTFGLGKNTPLVMGSASDSISALMPDGHWVVIRVPYPLGFFPKLADGRIDDPNAGWKGRGLWGAYSTVTSWHQEGGKGQTSKAVQFQLRPSPLAK